MKKLLFLIHTLGGGGAERALVNLVNHLNPEKYDITVETMFDDGINAKGLMPHIHYISKKAPCPKGTAQLLKMIPARALFRFFIGKKDYDLLIAYMHGIPVKVISGNKNTKKIAWLHNGNPETSTMFTCWLSENRAFKAYDCCDAIVGVCKSVSDAFSQYTHITKKVRVVYNTLDSNRIISLSKSNPPVFFDKQYINIVTTGRLGKEKGYSRLINVCKKIRDEGNSIKLYIIGSGTEEESLKRQVNNLSMDNTVFFLGFQDNPYQYVDKCDIFVCSSFTEGLSTATLEALILGKAIVSTDVSGAKEILGDNEYGIIVNNSEEGIYSGLKTLLNDRKNLNEYGIKAMKRGSFFSVNNTVNQAEIVFDSILNK